MPPSPGKFITLEGGEGTGKSTQARLLQAALRQRGLEVALTREPGGAPGAELIRKLLVEGDAARWDAMSEALLLFAARRVHLRETIIPALNRGEWVVCDRFTDSTFAYQGDAGGLGRGAIERLSAIALGKDSPVPDVTLVLDIPVELGLARANSRGGAENRFESLGTEFHQRLRDSFLQIAKSEPVRCALIDATPPPETVAADIIAVLASRLGI
ncbi:MAG: dTMP kinase [Alphaproteobacteria bacterium]|nr:dTMP kinase [Alphaproteobacteria bacterium]